MSKGYVGSKLSRQLAALVLAAFVLASAVYFAFSAVLEGAVCAYYGGHPEVVRGMAAERVRALQTMADAQGVAATDRAALSAFVGRHALMILHVFKDGRLTFDSTQETSSALHFHVQEHSPAAHQATQVVVFSDGPAQVSVAVFPEHAFSDLLNKALLLLSAFLCLGIILLGIRGKVRYLVKLEQEVLAIAGGDLHLPLTQRGTDELAMLSACIDEMRQAMIERIRQEESRQQERYEWVASMSHDLRTPLTALTGYLEIMAQEGLPGPSALYLAKCLEKASRLKDMTDMLFASFTSGAPGLETLTPMPAQDLLREFMEEGLAQLRAKGYGVHVSGQADGCTVLVQKAALHRVFDNIFENIGKYAPPGAPVTVALAAKEDSRLSILIQSGLGETTAHGSGLGLTICANLIRSMGGAFRAEAAGGMFVYRVELGAW